MPHILGEVPEAAIDGCWAEDLEDMAARPSPHHVHEACTVWSTDQACIHKQPDLVWIIHTCWISDRKSQLFKLIKKSIFIHHSALRLPTRNVDLGAPHSALLVSSTACELLSNPLDGAAAMPC